MAEEQGRLAEAEAQYRRVAPSDPNYIDALLRLGIIAARSGRNAMGQQLLRAVITHRPKSIDALNGLASIARSSGRREEAIALCKRALELQPDDPQALFGLGQCYLDSWANESAAAAFRRAIEADPTASNALDRLGVALHRDGKIDEAAESFLAAIAISPTAPESYVNLGQIYLGNDQPERAKLVFAQAFDGAIGSAPALVRLGFAFQEVGNIEQAEEAIRAAVKLDPIAEFPSTLLARILRSAGKFKESSRVLSETIQRHPGRANLYFDLAHAARINESDRSWVRQMGELASRPRLSPPERDRVHYALGKAYDDLGEYEEALGHFMAANAAALEQVPQVGEHGQLSGLATKMINLFTPEFLDINRSVGLQSNLPIFIVGLPRSGTTLVEQIVSSHPSVGAAGEVKFLSDQAYQLFVDPQFNVEFVDEFAKRYLRRLEFAVPGLPRVTDKMPMNILFAGLLHLMFPQAKTICCRRNVFDNCLSMFVTPYDLPNPFMHSASNIASLWNVHERLFEHWNSVLPRSNWMALDYEDLVSDHESAVRSLIEFLGLPWDDACLRHEGNKRAITTPSQWQARQGIYGSSVERWRHYEPWITELRGHLDLHGEA